MGWGLWWLGPGRSEVCVVGSGIGGVWQGLPVVGLGVVGAGARVSPAVWPRRLCGRRRVVGLACWWWERGQACEGGGQGAGPGPGAGESEGRATGVEGQPGGGVQEPVAQRLGFAGGEVAVERELLGPGQEVLGDQREFQPDRVVVKVAEGEVLQAG